MLRQIQRLVTVAAHSKRFWLFLAFSFLIISFFLLPYLKAASNETKIQTVVTAQPPGTSSAPAGLRMPERPALNIAVENYLNAKKSPIAPETDFLLEHKHWQLLLAISAIESQFCKRQLGYNCWGISNTRAVQKKTGYTYRRYASFRAAIDDADAYLESWQSRGKWLTVESMNCSYVVPCSPNWVRVVNKTLTELKKLE